MPLDDYDCGPVEYTKQTDIYKTTNIYDKLCELFSSELEHNEPVQKIMEEMRIKIEETRILLKTLEQRHITSIGLRFCYYKTGKPYWYHVTIWR